MSSVKDPVGFPDSVSLNRWMDVVEFMIVLVQTGERVCAASREMDQVFAAWESWPFIRALPLREPHCRKLIY